jgi:hypothetical protein
MPCITRRPEEAILFTGLLYSSQEIFDQALFVLKETFGDVLMQSLVLPWEHSSYYEEEIGSPLFRCFIFFCRLIDTATLADYKHSACSIEQNFSDPDNRRRINIDPGYITAAKVVLASRKNYSHRICIGRGIYAELELFFQDGKFNPLPYTYTDYRTSECLEVFRKARLLLKKITAVKQVID